MSDGFILPLTLERINFPNIVTAEIRETAFEKLKPLIF